MPTFLDRFFGRPSTPRSAKAVTDVGPWSGKVPLSSLGNDPQQRAAAYLRAYRVGWFYKAGSKISRDFAGLEWSVSDGDVDSDDPTETRIDQPDLDIDFDALKPIDQFMRLMERPNPYQTGRVLREKTCIRRDFGGLGLWYLEGGEGGGLPTAIYGVSPARMTPSYNKAGILIGWVMDKDQPSGGVPFSADEILAFSASGPDDDPFGVSIVEAVYAQVPLTDLMARHTADVLSTGGRLAGMLWPKERALDEAEFQDAQRAWRNTTSNGDAGRRLLLFPEPMEYAQGASSPAEIGIPELAALNRDEILTAFPLSPYQLGVPMPGGLNSAETRREDRRDYWEGTIHPRVTAFDEVIQVNLLSRYEKVMGQTFNFTTQEPNLDEPTNLLEKVAALRSLASAGFDEKEAVKAVGLDHIPFHGIPAPDPALATSVGDGADDNTSTTTSLGDKPAPGKPTPPQDKKAVKSVDDIADESVGRLQAFFAAQQKRVTDKLRSSLPAGKSQRIAAAKAEPSWWDAEFEDKELTATMRAIYAEVGRAGLQEVANTIGRFIYKGATNAVIADLLTVGGERIADINARTLHAITVELAEGTRRGYSIPQLIEGVPDEGYKGVLNAGLDNGVPAWSDARAETIARTETMLSYNRATVTGYGEFGVTHLLAYDGDDDPECAERNGQEFTIDEAQAIDDHPNGTLVWSPVVDR